MLYVVGVGPGDPSLATLKALDTIRRCKVVLGWRSVVERFKHLLDGKEVVYLTYGNQEAELRRAAERAAGDEVCLLVHGDPLVSDWELLERVRALGVDFEVVNGVSSVNVALGRVGLDLAQVVFLTMHASRPQDVAEVACVAKSRALVIFPPPGGIRRLAEALISLGMGKCRAVVLENLTLPGERVWRGSVEEMAELDAGDLTAVVVDCRVS